MTQRLYLDHAATTPMVLAAREAMRAAIARWANPSSPHAEGRAARAMLEDARARIAQALGWDGEGHTYRLNSDAVAVEVALALKAVKLIYLAPDDGIRLGGHVLRQISVDDAEALLIGSS